MADKDAGMQFTVLERNWLVHALKVLRGALVRSLTKELPSSEYAVFRKKEIEAIDVLIARF